MAPHSFISYARRNTDSYLERFLDDLRDEIVLREDVAKEDALFLDVDEPTGVDWKENLGEALMESRACVTIYTPSYFRSEYCGKEVQVFLNRADVGYDDKGAATSSKGIFPVLWSREKDLKKKGLPPAVVGNINYSGKRNHARYASEGLRSILQRDPTGLYLDLLNALANDIVDNEHTPPVLDELPDFTTTKNAFATPNVAAKNGETTASPLHLPFFLLTDKSSQGTFSFEETQKWLIDEEESGFTLQIDAVYPSTEDPKRLTDVLEAAGATNAQPIVILDPYLDEIPPAFGKALLEGSKWHGAVLLPRAEADAKYPTKKDRQAAVDAAVRATIGPDVDIPAALVVEGVPREREAFIIELRRVVVGLAKRLVEEGDLKRSLPEAGQTSRRPQIRGPRKRPEHD